ncbi:uncharacterized protein si:dkey-211g8.8 isoform X2 [Myxocyprinus asiaticus]|uniref:uncharacterized protein si:dkey-211g8.8 isoform X2 n=1 Tax=Myxocyprinus asiaticus TaxID=70543 RepID=UPI0022217F00|nr:uncharacterized protein si:dkey-211g8.8 isoform X2 [Myxocyprinus asiaticus]
MERTCETDKLKPKRGRKKRAAIKGGKFKECQTTKTMMSSIMKDVPVVLQNQERKRGKKMATDTIKARKTSQHTVAVENSSAKSLKVCNEQHQHSDSEDQCFPETSLNTGASSVADDRTQRNIRGVPVTLQKRKRRAKDASKHEKKTSKESVMSNISMVIQKNSVFLRPA